MSSITSFDNFNLKEDLLAGIYTFGFEYPSYVQSVGIEPITSGKDCIIQSQSGTGKTGAYVIGILQQLNLNLTYPQAIIIVPTRELVKQVYNVIRGISSKMDCNLMYLIGGTKVSNDINSFKKNKPHVIISTPGRLYDLLLKNIINTDYIKTLILDEADELLAGSFKEQIYEIFTHINNRTDMQVVLVSATIPDEVLSLSDKFLNDPIRVLVKTEDLTLEGIKQYVVYYDSNTTPENRRLHITNKFSTLMYVLDNIAFSQTVIYVNTRKTCEGLANLLYKNGYISSVIHSELTQKERNKAMSEFKHGSTRILLTTDLLSRGIDIQQISMVINYEMPESNEVYLHRSGRSGRFGRKGVCINFVYYMNVDIIKNLEEYFCTLILELPDKLEI